MPFTCTKREKNQKYYSKHANTVKETARKRYNIDKQRFINKSMLYNEDAASVNPSRVKKAAAKRVHEYRNRNLDTSKTDSTRYKSEQRQRDLDKAREDTRQSVAQHRQRDPAKAREDTRQSVAHHRQRDPAKARTDTRRSVSEHRLRNPDKGQS